MTRLALLLLPLLTAAGLALADDPAPARSPAERLDQFRHDLGLVRELVDGGLRLAGEDDPLKRADRCNLLARDLSREVQQAVQALDHKRGERFGQGLEQLLVQGVAVNLTRVADHPAPNAPSLTEVHRLSAEAMAVMEPVQKEFDRVPDSLKKHMKNVWQALKHGRARIEEARHKFEQSHGGFKARPALKMPSAGKKLKGSGGSRSGKH
jgi:hypothetical protein